MKAVEAVAAAMHTALVEDPGGTSALTAGGRQLGPWMMVPWWITVPAAIALACVLAWYFGRLGRTDVPRERRWIRRASIVCALAALIPLVRGLTFVHPHEDRAGFAVAWAIVLLAVVACLVLAVIDVMLTTRRGVHEYRELRRETLGGRREGGTGG